MNPPTRNVSLREKTSFRIGGKAAYYASAESADHILELLAWARENGRPVQVLGNGSNVLVSDAGWPGLVIDFAKGFRNIRWDGASAACDTGTALHALVQQSVERGLAGIEKMAGIPGTVGGALIMNAGAFGQQIADCVEYADIIALDSGEQSRLRKSEIEFEYRTSSLKKPGVLVVQAGLRFGEGDGEALRFVYTDTLRKRKTKQPLDKPNCGSVFKRPEGNYAGALVEQCGLKGHSVGDAMVSEKHANFIVNVGSARAEDVRRLIAQIQHKVHEETGVLLEPEVVFVGEFETPLYVP